MSRKFRQAMILGVIMGIVWLFTNRNGVPVTAPAPVATETRASTASSGSARQTWGHVDTLADHFARHGRDFHARDADDYAAQAAAFLQRAKANGLPAKRDSDGSLRIFDPSTGAFGAFNANGTTRTYFKPGSPGYFDRQPGVSVDLRTTR